MFVLKFHYKLILIVSIFILAFLSSVTIVHAEDISIKNDFYVSDGIYVIDENILKLSFSSLVSNSTVIVDVFPSGPWEEFKQYSYNAGLDEIIIPNLSLNSLYKIDITYNDLEDNNFKSFIVSTGDPHPVKPSSLFVRNHWEKIYNDESIKLEWKNDGNYIYDIQYKNGLNDTWEHLQPTWDKYIRFDPKLAGSYEWRVRAINGPYFSDYSYSKFNVDSYFKKYPIIFVHGWSGSSFEDSGICDSPNPNEYFENLDDDFVSLGFSVYYANLITSPCFTPPMYTNANILKIAIEKAKKETQSDKVVLISHSMGGLVSRAYIEGPKYENDVLSFFSLASANLGIPLDPILFNLKVKNFTIGFCLLQPAVCETTTTGMEIFNSIYKTDLAKADYHLVNGTGDDLNLLGTISSAMMLGKVNDGLVPLYSGLGISDADKYKTDENHNVLGVNNYFHIRDDGNKSMTYENCLKPILVDGSSQTCGSTDEIFDELSAVDSDFLVVKGEINNIFRNEYSKVTVRILNDNNIIIPEALSARVYFPDGSFNELLLFNDIYKEYFGELLIPIDMDSGFGYIEVFDSNGFLTSFDFIVSDVSLVFNKVDSILVNRVNKSVFVNLDVSLVDEELTTFIFSCDLINSNGNIIQSVIKDFNVSEFNGFINLEFNDVSDFLDIYGLDNISVSNISNVSVPIDFQKSIIFNRDSITYSDLFSETVIVKDVMFSLFP